MKEYSKPRVSLVEVTDDSVESLPTSEGVGKPIPFSEIVVTDNENSVLALITADDIVEYDGYHVVAR